MGQQIQMLGFYLAGFLSLVLVVLKLTIEGHWSWWVRVEGHFVKIPAEKKVQCDSQVREALQSLAGPQGIPYTIHELHVKLRHPNVKH